jgi:uncharacterized membrane protein
LGQAALFPKKVSKFFGFLFYFPLYEQGKVVYNIAIVYSEVRDVNCLKCGREIEEGQVFCNDCLVQMAKYPVKPGTAVQLPSRGSSAAAKKVHARRRGKTALEEQLKALKARVRVLSVLLAVCVVLLVVLSVVMLRYMSANRLLPGQNYSAVTATTPTEES